MTAIDQTARNRSDVDHQTARKRVDEAMVVKRLVVVPSPKLPTSVATAPSRGAVRPHRKTVINASADRDDVAQP